MDRHRPLLGNLAQGQIDHFVDRFIGGKNPMIARHFPQGHIHGLNGIGGVDHLANVLWEGKQRDHSGPMCPPRLADTGIKRIPFLGKQFQVELGLGFGTSRIGSL